MGKSIVESKFDGPKWLLVNEKINFYGYDIKFVKMALDNFQDIFFFFLWKKERIGNYSDTVHLLEDIT